MVNLHKQPSGHLKISAPPTLAIYLLGKVFAEYSQRYPEVKFNVILESRIVDIVQQGFDLALRSAALPDSTLISQRIGTLRYVLCASPAYLKKQGAIKHPEQLTQHIFATYSGSKSAKQLIFTHRNQQHKITITSHFQSNNLDLIAQMVTVGSCIAVLPEFMVKTLLAKKQLVICLPEFKLPEMPLYVVYPERDLIPLKVKTFIELLKTHLAKI